MKIFLLIFTFLVFSPQLSFALSDAEHMAFLRDSPSYKYTVKSFNDLWVFLKKNLPNEKYEIILRNQRNWIQKECDEVARVFMNNGFSRYEAYCHAIYVRMSELEDYYYYNSSRR